MANAEVKNPYLEEVLSLADGNLELLNSFDGLIEAAKLFRSRRELIYKYSFAIPNNEALRKIAEYSPIVEIGAGSGYWAHLLAKMDVDIIAYDHWKDPNRKQWFDVLLSDESAVKRHKDRSLFLCWPPFGDVMALNAMRQYEGEAVIYIGEDKGGNAANDSFFDFLYEHFEEVECVEIPVWPTTRDRVVILKRQ